MMQVISQTSSTHTISPQNSHSETTDDEDYFSEIEEEDSQDQDFYQEESEEEEEEDYPLVLYHLPQKKPNPQEELLKAQKLEERNEKIQERKQKAKEQDKLLCYVQSPNSFTFKLLSKLSRPQYQVNFACYVPERNLLFVALVNSTTVHIYSTLSTQNFSLVAERTARKQLGCMSYSKHLRKLIVGGERGLLQLWSVKSLEVSADSFEEENNPFINAEYVPKSHVIVAKSSFNILIYNTGLRRLRTIELHTYFREWYSDTAEIQGISKDFLLVACHYETWNRVSLINIKTGDSKPLANISVPSVSCVQITERSPLVFTCLAPAGNNAISSYTEWHIFQLMQFTIDTKSQELDIARQTKTAHFFSKLCRVENSKYLIAQRRNVMKNSNETFLLSVNRAKIEIVHVISKSEMTLSRFSTFIMTKEESAIIEINGKSMISVYGCVIPKEKNKKLF